MKKKPNVILIMADDMGYSDIGCFGSEIDTPNLDFMAEHGVRFSQMYNGARCCPTRASLLTGLYAHQAGVGQMVENDGIPAYQGYLRDDCLTIAEVLKREGYQTGMSGKWHVCGYYGINQEDWKTPGTEGYPTPRQRGFDRFYGTLAGAGNYFNPHTLREDDEFIQVEPDESYYYTDAISEQAAGMIREFSSSATPFFMYVAYTAPHWPLHALPEDIEKYRGTYLKGWEQLREERYKKLIEHGLIDGKWTISHSDEKVDKWDEIEDKAWEDMRMAVFAAQIDRMDQGIGKIMSTLRELKLEEDTLIMFLSDNGGESKILQEDGVLEKRVAPTRKGEKVEPGNLIGKMPGPEDTYMSYGPSWANASNSPFRRYKCFVHEGGISSPFIMYWPSQLKQNQNNIIHDPSHLIDIMATIVDVCDVEYPQTSHGKTITDLEGVSLYPLLQGEEIKRDKPIFWEHLGNCAVRQDEWKIVRMHGEPWELYHMGEDRTETTDLSQQMPQKVNELKQMYAEWAKRVGVVELDELKNMRKKIKSRTQ